MTFNLTPRNTCYDLKESEYYEHLDIEVSISYNEDYLDVAVYRGTACKSGSIKIYQENKLIDSVSDSSPNLTSNFAITSFSNSDGEVVYNNIDPTKQTMIVIDINPY